MQQNDELLSFVDKKLYSGLFLKRISEKLVDRNLRFYVTGKMIMC